MSSETIFVNESTVRISIEEFEYLKKCESELADIKDIIGGMLNEQ